MIDFRSDTVTRPGESMRRAMARAEVGDDVMGEDPTVNRLEAMAAERLGLEDGLFVPSGTQGNLLGVMAHCGRGDEYLVGQQAHTYRFEGGGAAVLGSIQPQPVENRPDGTMDLDEVEAAVKPDDAHFARTKLLALENTQGGRILSPDYQSRAEALARKHGLGFHLDGARVFNAAVAGRVAVDEITRAFDTVSFCLSKGLGAPVGSVLCGRRELVDRARRWRKVLGGGMRQAGIIAAAGVHALEHNVARLADDHSNARRLAEGLSAIEGIEIDMAAVETNMVFAILPEAADGGSGRPPLAEYLADHGVTIASGRRIRLVTHLDVREEDVDRTIALVRAYFGGPA